MQPVEEPCSVLKIAGATLARMNETCFTVSSFSNALQSIDNTHKSSLGGEFDVASRESVWSPWRIRSGRRKAAAKPV